MFEREIVDELVKKADSFRGLSSAAQESIKVDSSKLIANRT
jgi:hypothetical protein